MVGTSTVGTGQTPCVDGFAGEYPCENYDLLSVQTLEELGGGANGNDCWGWVDVDSQREFVLFGRSNGLSIVEVTDPVACNRTRADYNLSVNGNNVVGGQGACAPIPPRGQKVATLRQTPNDVWNECYLGRWLLEGGVAWDTYDSPLLGDEQPCLVRESPWDGAQNGTGASSPALPKVSTLDGKRKTSAEA